MSRTRSPANASDRREALAGGRTTTGVVRVGETVRRPAGAHSAFVRRLLSLYEAAGVEAAPRFLGVDELGRDVLTYLPGWVPPNLESRRWRDDQLVAAARLIRALHDVTAGSELAGQAEVVCHNDASPCNVVFGDGTPYALIDFDAAAPGPRVRDLAYAAWLWLLGPEVQGRLDSQLRQVVLLLDAYGLADRSRFAEAVAARQAETRDSLAAAGREEQRRWVEREAAWLRARTPEIRDAIEG